MKILYDITILGRSQNNERGKTGIFRVVENLAEELVLVQDCTTSFCQAEQGDAILNSLEYLKTKPKFNNILFSKVDNFDKFYKTFYYNKQSALKKILLNTKTTPFLKKASNRIEFSFLSYIDQIFFINKNFINPVDLKNSDIYHSPFLPISTKIRNQKNIKSFITIHDLIPLLYPKYFNRGSVDLMNRILNSITKDTWVLCVSESTKSDLLNYMGNRVDANKVFVTHLGASTLFYRNTDSFESARIRIKYGIGETPYILSVCTLEPRKNIDQTIRAFAQLLKQQHISDLNLVLVGTKGWDFDNIFSEIAKDKDVSKKIIITGYIDDEDLASVYSNAMMFVYPSMYEGFGLPILEAMKCGVPIVASNTSSIPEVVGDAGILVDPNNQIELASAILSVYENNTLREELTSKSLEQANSFSWSKCCEETVSSYKIAISQ